jgi:hypothetical protein
MNAKIDRKKMRDAVLARYRELKEENWQQDCFHRAVVESLPEDAGRDFFKVREWENELRQLLQDFPIPRHGIWPSEWNGRDLRSRREPPPSPCQDEEEAAPFEGEMEQPHQPGKGHRELLAELEAEAAEGARLAEETRLMRAESVALSNEIAEGNLRRLSPEKPTPAVQQGSEIDELRRRPGYTPPPYPLPGDFE